MSDDNQLAVPVAQATYFRRRLLRWYRRNGRRFPWRETVDPYLILLSEILLQRTQAPQVHDHYEEIASAFPTPERLADASIGEVRDALKPLGLAKRAVTLKSMGDELVRDFDEIVPAGVQDLMTLPGVGRYIAAATACFANGARVAVLDANVIRVLTRAFGVAASKERAREDPALWQLAESLLPRRNARDYNRALIDLASLVCRPRRPLCAVCPLRRKCNAASGFLGGAS